MSIIIESNGLYFIRTERLHHTLSERVVYGAAGKAQRFDNEHDAQQKVDYLKARRMIETFTFKTVKK